jgi:molybdopterin-dependent oxidoreductase alpha subunit
MTLRRDSEGTSSRAKTPLEAAAPRLSEPSDHAGGVGAIVSTMRHARAEMGVTRSVRTLLRVNQHDGFDCPGCAWPEPDRERPLAEFCENGAKAVASEATLRRAGPELFAEKSIDALAKESDFALNAYGRLTHPMLLREGAAHYEPVTWDEAFARVARALRALESPDQAVFYTSGRTSNEAAFVYQLFVRAFGTNNLPDCSNMCHESSGVALMDTIGVGKGTVQLEDFELAEAVFLIGQNPGTNHPRMLGTLEAARRRGATIVSINPLPEAGTSRFAHPQDPLDLLEGGTPLASLFLPVRVNGDVALLSALSKAVLERDAESGGRVVDHAFIATHTRGFDAFADSIRALEWSELEEQSGISRSDIERAADIYCASNRTIVCWAMGLTQHENGVENVRAVVNLLLLRGQIGVPGAGVCPVRGHSNVQGDRTMGISERIDDGFLDRLGETFGFEPPRHHGMSTVEAIEAMRDGRVRVFFGMGGNFLSAAPDTAATADALARCALTVHVSTKLNRAHLVPGSEALILPCLGRTERDVGPNGERFVTIENSMGIVHASVGALPPASPTLRSETDIVCGVARATLEGRSPIDWDALARDYDRIRDSIARVVEGCAEYNRRVRRKGGFKLPNAARERVFRTASGRAEFTVNPLPRHVLRPSELLLMTMRSHDQYNTTVYGMDDRYRGVAGGRRVVFMHPDDVASRGLCKGDLVDVISRADDGERIAPSFAVFPYAIPRGCAAMYFPEGNVLVPLSRRDARSLTPASKSIYVRVERTARAGRDQRVG